MRYICRAGTYIVFICPVGQDKGQLKGGVEQRGQMDLSFDTSFNLFKAVFETAPDIAVNLLNKDYRVLWANKIMAIGVQRSLDEMIGKPCYEVWRRRNTPCPVCLLKIVSDTGKPCVMERWLDLPNRERRYAEVRAYPIFDEHGFVKHVFEIIIQIKDKKKNEEQRRKYIESLEETVRELNAAGITDCNKTSTDVQEIALTPREREVLKLVARGFSNKEIADILSISPDTVKTHVRNIFSKLNVTDRTQAAVWTASQKLI
jgi:DNA-binding CsgD family transcriptional regulator